MKTLYAFSIMSDELTIKEIEVVKETEKQYLVKNFYGGRSCDHINKSQMTNGYRRYFETKEQAIDGVKHYCHEAIKNCNRQIEIYQSGIERFNKVLASMEENKE